MKSIGGPPYIEGDEGFQWKKKGKKKEIGREEMTMTMKHSEKPDIRQMKAWPYRQERRGHDPAKKENGVLMKLALLARCAQTHC